MTRNANGAFHQIIRSKGWTLAEVGIRWGVTERQMSRIANSGKLRDLDAAAGLPDRRQLDKSPWIFRVGNLYSAELLSHVAPHENGVIQPQPWEVLEPVLQAWTTEENRGWIAFNRESADLKYARFSTLPKWPAQRC